MIGLYFGLASSIIAIIVVLFLIKSVVSKEEGSDVMKKIAGQIRLGASAFLKREYLYIAVVVAVIAVAMLLAGKYFGYKSAVSFVWGAAVSASAGFIGMTIATRANVRTTHAADKAGMQGALGVAISGGAVMGLSVVGISLFGLIALIAGFHLFSETDPANFLKTLSMINSYAMGASLFALFARAGGGIFTKGADMGADLVGKVEAGIPEDDPRNPAVIADNVGDNVGDVAGLGADLLESYVESIIASMVLAVSTVSYGVMEVSVQNLPIVKSIVQVVLMIAAAGIISSIIGVMFVKIAARKNPQSALLGGTYVAAALTIGLAAVIIAVMGVDFGAKPFSKWGLFWSLISGISSGILIGFVSEYYTSSNFSPVKKLAKQCETGPAIGVVGGISLGLKSVFIPVIVLVFAIIISHSSAGMLGIGIASFGMLVTTGMIVSVDSYGPIADNAGGIAEMAGLPERVRDVTDKLDSVGNTTAAIGKGFAIGSAAFAAIGLLAAYIVSSGISEGMLALSSMKVIAGLLIGGMLPFLVSSMLFDATQKEAFKMVEEVRRQFREIKGLMEGKADPDSATCVDIATKSALKGMMVPGTIAILSPLVIGMIFGPVTLAGFLIGAIVAGIIIGIQYANSGGGMDNAKKYIEEGNFGGKGSEAHKAAVVGDTVGDPMKDTVGPSINILIKLMSVISLVLVPFIREINGLIWKLF
ncbi:MAG TPA: sodium-translocating pyrophosphatase [Spirochaetes bacterium]|nr:sodium-translocating pyrophosphatase [Spirochaetota bacterium]